MSSTWQPYSIRVGELEEVDTQLAVAPDALPLLLRRASLLGDLGRIEEAKTSYLKAVTLAPANFDALNNFGKFLLDAGYRSAAGTLFRQAVVHHPYNASAYTNLGNVCYLDCDLATARQCYEKALELSPQQLEAHRGLSYVLWELGDEEQSRTHRDLAFRGKSVIALPYRGQKTPIRVLQLISAVGGNAAVERFLDDRTFLTTIVVADYHDPAMPLPEHDVLLNAVADADLCGDALDASEKIAAKTTAPVVNRPQAVRATSRAEAGANLGAIPNVIAPKTVKLTKESLANHCLRTLSECGLGFPILLRSPGFHTGKHFERAEEPAELERVVAALPGSEVLAIQYMDSRGADGKHRKYRVMMIDGELYPLHLAIARDWKVHYFTAEMADNAAHRAEDAAFLAEMDSRLGERAMQALRDIQKSLGLEYAGIDFGLNAAGELVLFEANAAMNVLTPPADARWDYRRPHVQRILDAARRMILTRAASTIGK